MYKIWLKIINGSKCTIPRIASCSIHPFTNTFNASCLSGASLRSDGTTPYFQIKFTFGKRLNYNKSNLLLAQFNGDKHCIKAKLNKMCEPQRAVASQPLRHLCCQLQIQSPNQKPPTQSPVLLDR